MLWLIENYRRPELTRKIRVMNTLGEFQTQYYIDSIPGAKDRFVLT
jgi:hypothetical protein